MTSQPDSRILDAASSEEIDQQTPQRICLRNRIKPIGDIHGSTILRAIRALAPTIAETTPYYTGTLSERTLWPDMGKLATLDKPQKVAMMQYFGALQANMVLRILMDSPIKFAYMGCLAADEDINTSMIFQFSKTEEEVERLKELR